VTGPGTLTVSGAGTSLVILPTGTLNLNADVGFGADTQATITNEGTFIKTSPSGTGTSTIVQPFTNTGTVQINSGTLAFPNGFTQTAGTTTIAAGATLHGDVALNGGILAGNGTVNGNVTGTGAIGSTTTPGLLTVNGDVNLSGPLNTTLAGTSAGTQFS